MHLQGCCEIESTDGNCSQEHQRIDSAGRARLLEDPTMIQDTELLFRKQMLCREARRARASEKANAYMQSNAG